MAQPQKQVAASPTSGPKSEAKAASHDTVNPPALLKFMTEDWRPAAKKLPPKVRGAERFMARRRALSAAFPGDLLIIPTGHEKVRANDTYYRFRPGSDFYYLTGNLEPDCVLAMVPKEGGGHEDILFVEPNPGRSDTTFFTDRNKGELWVGPRLGVGQSQYRYQVHKAASLATLNDFVKEQVSSKAKLRLLRGFSPTIERLVGEAGDTDRELATVLSEMRLLKDSLEISALKRACASTRRGFEDVIRRLKIAKSEREVEGVFNLRARVEGNDVGYGTIAASGAHACVLHWTHNDGKVKKGDLLLLDAGVEDNELYTADVTRTIPISGKFSPAQREVYELVLQAQAEAFKAVRPGNDFMAPNRVAMLVLAKGLVAMGILKTTVEDAMADAHQFYKRYTLHNVSHMLGLDVHDCAQARQEAYKYGTLRPGMVLTVEPGLYFQLDDLTVPARYRGIGVRIEDDVVVTAKGYSILSDLPRETADVERWMAKVWKTKAIG